MTVGKAIYYLLNNSTDLEAVVGTRIFPEVAEQDSALPFVMYSIISNEPSDTHSGPSLLDVAQVDVIAYNTSYSGCIDMGVYIRAALDRVTGTYNGVNVQSCQYNSEVIDFDEYKRAYVITQSYDVRISRTAFDIAQGTPVTGALLGDLSDVTITDPLEHDALIYDPVTENWVNGIPTDIPVINTSGNTLYAGSPLRATGVQGDKVIAALWTPSQDPKLFMGLAATDIAASETGHCRQIGIVHHLDTSTFEIGDILYPLASTLQIGIKRLGTTPPDHPLARVACAIVLRKHENTGRVFVRTWQPTYDFNDISEVNIATTPNDGQALTYDSATGTWVPGNATPNLLGDISDVQTYDPALLQQNTILRWNATSQTWELVPQTSGLPSAYYLGAYDTEAGTGRIAASTASVTVERYLTIQGDGEGESITAQSDTPSSGNKIVRKIWFKANSFETSDVDTWTLVHTFADDTAYASTEATFEALLNAQTYGTPPFTIAQSWEDVPAFTGLLDTYSGAAAAYSLRLLDSAYTGDAINVRRASDNAVQDIGFDANGDLDTSALATFCAGTDGYVVRWYDQSGNGNDAVQATTSAQPQIVASGSVVTQNGITAMDYAGTKYLATSATYSADSVKTIFSVANIASSAYQHLFEIGNSWNGRMFMQVDNLNSAQMWRTLSSNSQDYYRVIYGTINTSQHLFYLNYNYTNSRIALDAGTGVTGNTGADSGLSAPLYIGARQLVPGTENWTGKIQSFIMYESDQSSNRAGIESNINSEYLIYNQPSPTGLLADYPGAAVAYSLRQLISTARWAIAVRRASDDAVKYIGFDGNGDLDTATLAAFCSGTDGFVAVWVDQSGNGNDATQATTSAQPQIVSSGAVLTENSLAAMSINGAVFQRLQITNPLSGQPATVFSVYKASTNSSFPYNSSIGDFTHIGRRSTDEYFLNAGNVIATGTHPSTQVLSAALYKGASSAAYWNGVSQLTGDAGTNAHIDVIGSYPNFNRMNGTIQEIVIYDSDLFANRAGIESNINTYYSIY